MKLPLIMPSPSKRLLALRVKLKSKPCLASVINSVEKTCEPLFILTPYQVGRENEAFVIVTRACAEEAAEELKNCEDVADVEVLEDLPARELFPLEIGDDRCIIYCETPLIAFYTGIYKFMAPDMAKTMLYHIGYYSGREIGVRVMSVMQGMNGAEVFRYYLEKLFTLGGGGLVESIDMSDDEVIVRIADLIECVVQKKEGLMFGSHFYRGFLAGLASSLLGGNYAAEEKACITRGALRCVFIITKSSRSSSTR